MAAEDYITTAYAKTFMGVSVNDDDAFIASLITAASILLDDYLGRKIKSQTCSEYYSLSRSSPSLMLRTYPVSAVSQVTYYPHNATQRETVSGSNFVYDERTGELQVDDDSSKQYLFPQGFKTVLVEYTAGYSTVPASLQQACAMVVTKLYRLRGQDLNTTSEKIGDTETTWTKYATADVLKSEDIRELLNPYRNRFV
jgi:uncharacterized phiE125 gp8 family phage protein